MRYSAHSQEAERAEAFGAAGSREYPGYQLSHPEAVDLPRKNQVGEDARRSSSRAGKRDRPDVSQETESRGYRNAAREFPQDQRPKPADRTRGGHQIQWTARAGHYGDRRAAHYVDYHSGRGQGAAAEARRPGRRPQQINRSNDIESVISDKPTKSLAHVVPRHSAHFFCFPCLVRSASSRKRNPHSSSGGLEFCNGRIIGAV